MVTSSEEITRRLEEKDAARSARRAEAATKVGELARQHAELTAQIAELERALGRTLSAARDVLEVGELAAVTDISAADLTRWSEQAATPARAKRKRATPKNNQSRSQEQPGTTAKPAVGQGEPEVVSAPAGAAGT